MAIIYLNSWNIVTYKRNKKQYIVGVDANSGEGVVMPILSQESLFDRALNTTVTKIRSTNSSIHAVDMPRAPHVKGFRVYRALLSELRHPETDYKWLHPF